MGRLAASGVVCCAATLLLHAQAPPAERSRLNGAWTLEAPIEPERDVNWQRPTPSRSTASSGGGRGGASGVDIQPCIEMPPRQELDGTRAAFEPCPRSSAAAMMDLARIGALRTMGKTLIAESLTLTISVEAKAVTIGDDFFKPTSFTMSWRGHRLAVPSGRTRMYAHYETLAVKTRWEGDALVQDLSATSFGGFKLTRVFKLAEDGRRLLMLIHVEKPKITPPVEDMTRAYVREGK